MSDMDIILDILYPVNEPDNTVITTNAKKDAIEEILENWLRGQMGLGADTSKPDMKDEFRIRIGVDLSSDTFYATSDTGNKSLTCGIVRDVFGRLDRIKIE
jgi:hypothetical protein